MDNESDCSEREVLHRSGASRRIRIRKPCSVEGCSTLSQQRGLCGKHGGRAGCREEGCTKAAVSGGLCFAHGGDNSKPCSVEGCST
jgi:hypothetical protein